jgi:hypothetical protein
MPMIIAKIETIGVQIQWLVSEGGIKPKFLLSITRAGLWQSLRDGTY